MEGMGGGSRVRKKRGEKSMIHNEPALPQDKPSSSGDKETPEVTLSSMVAVVDADWPMVHAEQVSVV